MNETYLDLKNKIFKNSTKEERDYIRILDKFLETSFTEKDLTWMNQLIKKIDDID